MFQGAPQHYHPDSNYITAFFIMTGFFFETFYFGKQGNQLIAVLIPCYNTAETVFVYDPFHFDTIFAITK